MKRNIIAVAVGIAFAGVLALASEWAVRTFMPDVNLQGTDRRLFLDNVFGDSRAWAPNSTGVCFGKRIHIDSLGFREMAHPDHTKVSWLLLGDSVIFGVGVDADSTFAALLQKAHPEVYVWNTGTIGYAIKDYARIVPHLLRKDPTIKRVLLFWCLNDIYVSREDQVKNPSKFPLLGFLRYHSKAYIVLKNLLSDRSKVYFRHDLLIYGKTKPEFLRTVEELAKIKSDCDARGIRLTIILLPYEYQLRPGHDDRLLPQRLLTQACDSLNIAVIDPWRNLSSATGKSKALYLFADGIHFSPFGHRILFEVLQSAIAAWQ